MISQEVVQYVVGSLLVIFQVVIAKAVWSGVAFVKELRDHVATQNGRVGKLEEFKEATLRGERECKAAILRELDTLRERLP